MIAFGLFFFFTLNVFTELNTSATGETSVVLYKRGAKSAPVEESNEKGDEEKGGRSRQPASDEFADRNNKALNETPKMTDVFSWQNLNYVVPIGKGETRKLLDDVFGFVMPGKLTALMGSSGAGKVCFFLPFSSTRLLMQLLDNSFERTCWSYRCRCYYWGPICQRTWAPSRFPISSRILSTDGHTSTRNYCSGGITILCKAASTRVCASCRKGSIR